jgi:serine/threonine protein kinase
VKTDIDVNFEPLPGYRLIEHLGSGGYGEVWRAEAPGGLTKAIKFVFGQQHEKRATNELRALDRVRGVRHPFLLSLERIEIVEGRLVVVTELADGSIKDRFDACRCEGLPGIPRAELLGYLRDAADALDFMSEAHALQHLDIKPENLLLLAGHVKVADFGLVKEVRQSQASLVGGMTPLYAPPEVFRGSPSTHSDQYSLAIVYQEMLTGTLPFAGGNPAELTLQHLNDEPELSSLSAADRYAVARAMSKDPQHRYASCREFVDALVKVAATESTFAAAAPTRSTASEFTSAFAAPSRQNLQTDLFDDDETNVWNSPQRQLLVDLSPADSQLIDLPRVELTARDTRPAPTLVLGVGGAAGRVLSHLRRLMRERIGANPLPSVQFLLIDTDTRALSDATRNDVLTNDDVLNLPLRRPQHYREHSQQILSWLSRRWLYNIPRSLRTEGLRPLGRLALADHARQTGQRIRRAMMQAREPEAIATSNKVLGKDIRSDALRVCVVASISGGTGSGMSLDIGYIVRAILEKLGVHDARVHGFMMHSTGGDPRHCELARVNAFSWLTEFNHFQQPENAYPGDASCGLPPHPAGESAFDDTYLIHLGENLSAVEFDQATHSVAEYLCLNALSPAAAFFDACRRCEAQPSNVGIQGTLRSFGVFHRTAAPHEFCEELAAILGQQVLATWRKSDRKSQLPGTTGSPQGMQPDENIAAPSDLAPGVAQLIRRLQLDSAGIAANARALVEFELGGDPAAYLTSWFAKQGLGNEAGEAVRLQAVDQVFGDADSNQSDGRKASLLDRSVATIVAPFAVKLRSEVRRWVTNRVDDPKERVNGARFGAQWIERHLRSVEGDLQRLRGAVAEKLLTLRRDAADAATAPATGELSRALSYFRARLEQLASLAAEHVVYLLLCDVKGLSDEIINLGREIDQIAAAVCRAGGSGASNGAGSVSSRSAAEARLVAMLQPRLPEIAASIDARLQAEYINPLGGLMKVVMQGGRPRARLTAKLHEFSRLAVQDALAGMNVLEQSLAESGAQPSDELRSAVAAATPALLAFGGRRRVLAILPRDAAGILTPAGFEQAIGAEITAVAGADNNLTLCVEADGLSLPHIAAEIVEQRRDRVEFASRVHCRNDVAWTPLIASAATPAVGSWHGEAAIETESEQSMCKTLVM